MKKLILVFLIIFSLFACASTQYMSEKEKKAQYDNIFWDVIGQATKELLVP